MVHATPATSGGANSAGCWPAAIKPLNGVLVRTTIQENASPITTAIKVPPPQAIRVLNSASATFGLARTARSWMIERWRRLKPSTTGLVSVSSAEQQSKERIDNQKAKDGQQQRNPQPAMTRRRMSSTAAAPDLDAPAHCPFIALFPQPAAPLLFVAAMHSKALVIARPAGSSRKSVAAAIIRPAQ